MTPVRWLVEVIVVELLKTTKINEFGSLALHSSYYKSIYFKIAFSLFDKPNHNMTQLHEIHVIFLCYLVYFSCGVILRMYVIY